MLGREGEGPGEYLSPELFREVRPGVLLVSESSPLTETCSSPSRWMNTMSRVLFATRSLNRVERGHGVGVVRVLGARIVVARSCCTPVRHSTPIATRYPLLLRLGLTAVMAAAFCTPGVGQVVRGTVSEADTGTPVAYARLLLLDEGCRPVGSFVSDEVGRFEFTVPPGT